MIKIKDIEKINWLVDIRKQLQGLLETKKLGLADSEFVQPRILTLQVNASYPSAEIIQGLIFSLLKNSLSQSINETINAIDCQLKQLNVEI